MIQQVRVKNFKSIIDSGDVELNEFNIIVGKNGSGKTNLLLAFRFLHDIVMGSRITEVAKNICVVYEELFPNLDSDRQIEIEVHYKNGTDFKYSIRIGLHTSSRKEKKFFISSEKLLQGDGTPIFERNDNNSLKNASGGYIPLALDDDESGAGKYKEPTVEKFRKEVSSALYFDLIENDSIKAYRDDGQLAKDFVDLRRNEPERYSMLVEIINKLIPNLSEFKEFSTTNKTDENDVYFFVFQSKLIKRRTSIRSQSLGDIKTLAFFTRLLSMSKFGTIFIEEIENSFHASRLLEIIRYLEALVYKFDLQVILTTHNNELINKSRVSDLIYTSQERGTGTLFSRFSDSKYLEGIKDVLAKGGEISDYIRSQL